MEASLEKAPVSIESLPSELLDFIFELVIPDHIVYVDTIGDSALDPVVLLGHVCPSWRERVNTSPKMWTPLVLLFNHSGRGSRDSSFFTRRMEYLSHVLSMSAPLPLSLTMKIAGSFKKDQTSSMIFALVAQHFERWQHVEMDRRLASLHPPHAPTLISLTVQSTSSLIHDQVPFSFSVFLGRCPQLQHLEWNPGHPYLERRLQVGDQLPWVNLETLSGVSDIVWLARASPFLRQLKNLSIYDPTFLEEASDVQLDLPLLTTLSISWATGPNLVHLISLLTLPSLHTLSIRLPESVPNPMAVGELQSFRLRSSSAVRELEISVAGDDSFVHAVLHLFPTLESLNWTPASVRWSHMGPSILKFLSETTRVSGTLDGVQLRHLPHLHSLAILGRKTFSDDGLLDLLEFRTDPNISPVVLRNIQIAVRTSDLKWNLDRVENLRRRGVTISTQHLDQRNVWIYIRKGGRVGGVGV